MKRATPTDHPPFFAERRGPAGAGGPPVVLLHGLAASGRYWYRVAEQSGDSRSPLYLVDLLGFGRSPWPDVSYTVDEHLAALEAWRAAAGLAGTPLVVVGHSLGAILALEWTARRPAFVGAVLVGLPVYRDARQARRRLARLSLLHRLTLTSRPLARATCAAMCRIRPLWRLLAPRLAPAFPPEVARDGVLHSWRSLSGTLDNVIFGTTFARVRRAAAGRLLVFVHGARDDTAPVETVRDLVRDLPRARLLVAPDAGHDLPLSHPERVAEAIRGVSRGSTPRAGRPISD